MTGVVNASTEINKVVNDIAELIKQEEDRKSLTTEQNFLDEMKKLNDYFEVKYSGRIGLAVARVMARKDTPLTFDNNLFRSWWPTDKDNEVKPFSVSFKTDAVLAQCNIMGADDLLYIERPLLLQNNFGATATEPLTARQQSFLKSFIMSALYGGLFGAFPMCDIALKISKFPHRLIQSTNHAYSLADNEMQHEYKTISQCAAQRNFIVAHTDQTKGGLIIFQSPVRTPTSADPTTSNKPLVRSLDEFKFLGAQAPPLS